MTLKLVLDRFEENIAVCIDNEGNRHLVDKSILPNIKVNDIFSKSVHLAAAPFRYGVGVEKLKIFVSAVYKTDVEFFVAELFEDFLLVFAVIPNKAEIAADNQRVALFELLDCGRIEAGNIAVHIAGYINH